MKRLLALVILSAMLAGQSFGQGQNFGNYVAINAQTSTTYTVSNTDFAKLVTLSNVGAIAVTLPQAGTVGLNTGWYVYVENVGAGTVTITPTTSTIDGAATLVLTTNQGAMLVSNGTNYASVRGVGLSSVYASGGTTINVLCKSNGSSLCVDSSVTDASGVVSTTGIIQTADGAVGAPAYSFTTATGLGFWRATSTAISVALGGNNILGLNSGGLLLQSGGTVAFTNSATNAFGTTDTFISRGGAAATLQIGAANLNGTPVNQALRTQGAITGTDLPGGRLDIYAGPGTGAGATSQTSISRALMLGTGTTTQSTANAIVVCESKTLSNTTATTTTFATIGLASNAGGGASVFITLVASDGTNFDAETQSINLSYVNKATVMTVSTPTITASSAANNSGSATIGFTATGASPTISLKVTPAFTTIVPTTVTMYAEIMNHGAGAVSCQ